MMDIHKREAQYIVPDNSGDRARDSLDIDFNVGLRQVSSIHSVTRLGIEKARKRAQWQRKYARSFYSLVLKDILALRIPGDYLEVGAGSGFLAAMLAEDSSVRSITAVDISADEVAIANEYISERKLGDRVRCLVGDVYDENMMRGLGRYNLVYSVLSLHHWRDPVKSISNLWDAVGADGVLYIYDLKRVWLASLFRFRNKGIDSRDSYTPAEIEAVLQELGVAAYNARTRFPYFLLSVTAWK